MFSTVHRLDVWLGELGMAQRKALLRAGLLSFALHLAVVVLVGVPPARKEGAAASSGASPLRVRLLTAGSGQASRPLPIPRPEVSVDSPQERAVEASRTAPVAGLSPDRQGLGFRDPLLSLAPPVGMPYFSAREVDQPAAPLHHADLVYPEGAMRVRQGGSVVMDVYVGPGGTLDRLVVVRAEPPGVFEQAVVDALRASRFRAAVRDGVAVGSRVTIEVKFDPDCSDFQTCTPKQ